MSDGVETADSYKTSADLLLNKRGDKAKIINYLLKAAELYGSEHREKAIDCLEQINRNLRGSTTEFGLDQYFRYMHRLARSFEKLDEFLSAADIYSQLAKEIYKSKDRLKADSSYSENQILKKFSAYLAKALILYDTEEKYDSILKIARIYYKAFPDLQEHDNIHGELFFCYKHIINAADVTGSRYFREYYAGLDRDMKGISMYHKYKQKSDDERKGPYG